MEGPIFGLCAVLTLLSTAIAISRSLVQKRRSGKTYRLALSAHLVALVSSFVGSLLAVPTMADIADRATTAELSTLVSDIAAVIFCASLQILIIDWEYYRELPHYVSIACRVTLVLMVTSLLIWQFRRADPTGLGVELSTSYARISEVRTYLLTYLCFFAAAGAEVAMRAAKLAYGMRRTGRSAGTGMAVAAAGAVLGVLYAMSRSGYVLAYEAGHAWPSTLERIISPALAGLSLGGIVAGLSMAVLANSRSGSSTPRTCPAD
ncbi:hypothetical protein J7I94_37100, partial [Streptomyces sp. ISL-12]|uniref:hypothetical protein n=1 Tax=Streptomyces sp. ISL-12 TaxID=2819177 RepID=UPI001BEB0760